MIKNIIIINYLGESLNLELTHPEKTGIYIKSITGLGPGKANINTTDLASDDGSIYNSARATERNIVMTLGFMQIPGITDTIEDARQLTYKYFPRKKPITFYVLTDNRELFTTGYVESNEPDIFSKEETAQISIICPDPNFYALNVPTTVFSGTESVFEFPFENNTVGEETTFIPGISSEKQVIVSSYANLPETGMKGVFYFVALGDNYFDEYVWLSTGYQKIAENRYYYLPDIIFGNIVLAKDRNIYYDGDVEMGVNIRLHFTGQVTNLTIYNTGTRESMSIDTAKIESLTGAGIVAGDDIYIDTNKGNKSVTLLRGGYTYNILNALNKNADWFTLAKGDNVFTYVAQYGSEYVQFSIKNNIAFEGV